MANVRCPMCSKINAPEAENCAFCGARIKPLGSSASTPAAPSQDDEPDWMKGLRSGSTPADEPPGEPQGEDADSDVPDWLSRIRSRAQTETGAGDENTPDWMSGIRGDLSDAESGQPAPAEPEAGSDWLSQFQDSSAEQPDQEAPFGSASMDWLSSFSDEPAAEPPANGGVRSETPASSGDDDWMGKLTQWGGETEEPSAPSSGGADWLSSLSPASPGKEETSNEPSEGFSSGTGLTGFLASLEGGSEPSQEPEGFTPADIFGSGEDFSAEQPSSEETTSSFDWGASFAAPAGEGEQDWLSSLQAPSEPAQDSWVQELGGQEPVAFEPPAGESEDLPAWLSGLGGEAPTPGALPSFEEASGEESLPAWLSGDISQAPQPEPEQQGEEEGVPGWLSTLPGEPEASELAAGDLPAWLGEVPAAGLPEETAPEPGLPEPSPVEGGQLPEWFSSFESPVEEELPSAAASADDWLSGFQSDEPAASVEEPAPARTTGSLPFIDESTPTWLREYEAQQPPDSGTETPALVGMDEQPEEPVVHFEEEQPFAMDLPDWLSEETAAPRAEVEEQASGAPLEELAEAELPSWVAAMRPVESIIPSESVALEEAQPAEKSGPLAGVRGVLPIAENLFRYRKPPVYSTKLRLTEKQRTQASLLDNIIAQEGQPLLIPPERSQAPRLFMRILLALLLVIVLLAPVMPGLDFEPIAMPVLYPPELQEMFFNIDQNLQQGEEATVLLAVDYQPALSGEMRAAASPVVSHLMNRNVRIVVVSTVASGGALADHLLREVSGASVPGYRVDERTMNLGYLPGGALSLLEFIKNPSASAPATFTGYMAWQDSFLASIDSFSDFAQVIVLTDSAETGRAWVEQIGPAAGEVPLFMVVSAQAAPLLAPYLSESIGQGSSLGGRSFGQIDGMVAGLMGGAQYGWLAQQPNNPASNYWASYQVGVILAILLILAGGLYSGARRLFSRNNEEA